MAKTRTPPDRWVDAGLEALSRGGPQTVRIEPLAQTLGVSKGGFYWHFKDRRALLEEMLDRWERQSIEEVVDEIERRGGDARAKLRRLFSLAADRRNLLLIVDLAVRDWARHEQWVANRLRKVDNRRMDYMRTLFGDFCPDEAEVEARCLLVFSLWIGSHFMAVDHGEYSREDVRKIALRRLLS